MKFKKLKSNINKYEKGLAIDLSLDEIKQLVDESFDINDISGDEYDELLELMEELEEY